jgi:Zn-dependent M28 family amino/carboxypeptidase
MRRLVALTAALWSAAALGGAQAQDRPSLVYQGSGPIDPAQMSETIKVMASEEFQGRNPGTAGETKTIAYLTKRFKDLGLEPGGEKGSWTQRVPLIRFQVSPTSTFSVSTKTGETALIQAEDLYLTSQRPTAKIAVDKAKMVFVGYGVSAPERGWDDFKGTDVRGKILLMLINDPDFEAKPSDGAFGKFSGLAATYYARWTYRFEEAARRGAAGLLIIHDTPGAGYGWSTVTAPGGESFDIVRADPIKERVLLQGWIQQGVAAQLFQQSGLDLQALKQQARQSDFKPVTLPGALFSAKLSHQFTGVESHNVLAKLTGKTRPLESIMFSAHWDAYGVGKPDAQGRTVRPGAADDAIGVAGTIELARAFAKGPRPDRTLVFAAWTAEERGLLGSETYGVHPTLPLETTVANLTMDVLQTAGPAKDVVLVGYGQNELEDDLAAAAAEQGRTITPDAKPERALFYRADHFSLAKRGVPVLLLMGMGGGADLVEGARAAGDRWVADYTANCYHQTCDVWKPDWDLRGAAQDVALFYEIGLRLANSGRWPTWHSGSEFKPIRDLSAAKR